MPGALSEAEILEIKAAFELPFDTFATFAARAVITTVPFGRFKAATETAEVEIAGYKIEAKNAPGKVKMFPYGNFDLFEEVFLIKPKVAIDAGLVDPATGKITLVEARDTLKYEGAEYQIDRAKNVGWFDGEYQLYILGLTRLQKEI